MTEADGWGPADGDGTVRGEQDLARKPDLSPELRKKVEDLQGRLLEQIRAQEARSAGSAGERLAMLEEAEALARTDPSLVQSLDAHDRMDELFDRWRRLGPTSPYGSVLDFELAHRLLRARATLKGQVGHPLAAEGTRQEEFADDAGSADGPDSPDETGSLSHVPRMRRRLVRSLRRRARRFLFGRSIDAATPALRELRTDISLELLTEQTGPWRTQRAVENPWTQASRSAHLFAGDTPPGPIPSIFISCSSSDARLRDALLSALSVSGSVVGPLATSTAVLVLTSRFCDTTQDSALSAEWTMIQHRIWGDPRLRVVPVRLDTSPVPAFVSSFPFLDATQDPVDPRRLAEKVLKAVGQDPATPVIDGPAKEATDRRFTALREACGAAGQRGDADDGGRP